MNVQDVKNIKTDYEIDYELGIEPTGDWIIEPQVSAEVLETKISNAKTYIHSNVAAVERIYRKYVVRSRHLSTAIYSNDRL